jgi:hypothetical protein
MREVGLRLRERLAHALHFGLQRGLCVAKRGELGLALLELARGGGVRGLLGRQRIAQRIGRGTQLGMGGRDIARRVDGRLQAAESLAILAGARGGLRQLGGETVALGLQRRQPRILCRAARGEAHQHEADEEQGEAGESDDGEGERSHAASCGRAVRGHS